MGVMRVMHIYNRGTGLVEDGCVNTWHFDSGNLGPDVTAVNAQTMVNLVGDFYNLAVGAGSRVGTYIGEKSFVALRETYKVYDLTDAPPRQPVLTVTPAIVVGNNGTTCLPSEVAVCLSLKGTVVSGQNAARRRGRLFIGPLNTAASMEDASWQARPSTALKTALLAGANRLHDDAATAGWEWSIYSRTTQGADIYSQMVHISDAWVDDAFDTQRRRGVGPTTRTLQSL